MGLARVITSVVKIFTGMFQMTELHDFWEIAADDIGKINVSSTSTGVIIAPSDQDEIIVELKGQVSTRIADNFKLDVNKINNTLNISVAKKKLTFVLFGFIIDQSKLYVTVPKRLYENLSVET